MKVGYQRCSTVSQNLDSQEASLIEFGCEKIFSDKITGVSQIHQRQGLKEAIDFCRAGDQFVCYSISRASRDLKTLLELVETLNARGVEFISITEPFLSTSRNNPSSMFVISILGACASLQRSIQKEHCKLGIEVAKSKGVKFGRKPIFEEKLPILRRLLAGGASDKEAMADLGVSRGTFYKMKSMLVDDCLSVS